jgi:hypothetical protein
MPFPGTSELVRALDISWYQGVAGLLRRPIDMTEFCRLNPDIDLFVIHANWNNGNPDGYFDDYYDALTDLGKRVGAYVWPNVTKSVSATVNDWKRALGDRQPRLLGLDLERTKENSGATPKQINANFAACLEALNTWWPESERLPYSRGNLIDAWLDGGDWMHEVKWWLAHYISPPHLGRKAVSFEEIEGILPIDNNFTPYRSRLLGVEEVAGWQFSDTVKLPGYKGSLDADLFLADFVHSVYDDEDPPAPPAPPDPGPEPVAVQVIVPAGRATVSVTEQ